MLEGADPGDGFDAADTCSDRAFVYDFEDANIAGAVDVRAAAEFLGIKATRRALVGNRDDTNVALRVFVAEKGQRAGGQRVFERTDVRFDLSVVANLVVYLLLDVFELLGIDVGEMRKIKAQPLGSIQGACLLHVRPQNIPQRRMYQVRSAMIANDARAALRVRDDREAISQAKRLLRYNFMRDESGNGIKIGRAHV